MRRQRLNNPPQPRVVYLSSSEDESDNRGNEFNFLDEETWDFELFQNQQRQHQQPQHQQQQQNQQPQRNQQQPQQIKQLIIICAICMDSPNEPVSTSCGHLFCKSCLDNWITISSNNPTRPATCPKCRNIISPNLTHRIYVD